MSNGRQSPLHLWLATKKTYNLSLWIALHIDHDLNFWLSLHIPYDLSLWLALHMTYGLSVRLMTLAPTLMATGTSFQSSAKPSVLAPQRSRPPCGFRSYGFLCLKSGMCSLYPLPLEPIATVLYPFAVLAFSARGFVLGNFGLL